MEITERLMLPTVLTMANDAVANVRFNVAKTLTIVGPKLGPAAMQTHIKPTLSKLNDDSDFDVRFFASEAALGETEVVYLWPADLKTLPSFQRVPARPLLEKSN